MKAGVDRAGWTLKELAQDQDLVGDAPAPLFAWSLLRLEEQYLDALGGGSSVELDAARDTLSRALLAQLELDRESLDKLVPGDDGYEAARTRSRVVQARLEAVASADGSALPPSSGGRARRARRRTQVAGSRRTAGWMMRPAPVLASIGALVVLAIAVVWISSTNHEKSGRLKAAATSTVSPPPSTSSTASTPPAGTNTTGASTTSTTASTDGAATEVGQVLPSVVSAVNAAAARRALPSPLDPPPAQLALDADRLRRSCLAWGHSTTSSICQLGDPLSHKVLVLLGDSQALMWLPAVRALAQAEHWQLVPLLKIGCHAASWASPHHNGHCSAWFRWALSQDKALRPAVTLVAGAYSYEGANNQQSVATGLQAAVTGVKSRSSRAVVIGDVPWRTKQTVNCLHAPKPTMASCSEPLTLVEAELTTLAAQVVAASHASFINPTGWFCYKAQCPLVVGNIITVRGANHVTSVYALALSKVFRSAFDQAFRLG